MTSSAIVTAEAEDKMSVAIQHSKCKCKYLPKKQVGIKLRFVKIEILKESAAKFRFNYATPKVVHLF